MIFYFYALAFLFLPFDFFTFYEQNMFGTTWTTSKMLQIITYAMILVKIIIDKDKLIIKEIIASYILHKYFLVFIGFMISVSLIGILNNNYNLVLNGDNFKLSIRPITEILILCHQYFFFIVLAPIIINSKTKIKSIMQLLFLSLILNLILAFIDFGLKIYDIEFIARHFVDGRDVGYRLHGLFGEPRDAYVGLIFSLCFVHVYKNYFNKKLSNVFSIIISLFLVLTFSTSAFVGGVIYLVIIFLVKGILFFSHSQLKLKTWILTISLFVVLSFFYNTRNSIYIIQLFETLLNTLIYYNLNDLANFLKNNFPFHWFDLKEPIVYFRNYLSLSPLEGNIPLGADRTGTGVAAHLVNLLPFLDYIDRINRVEIWDFLFGTGSGTTSIFFNKVTNTNMIANPHSQFVKILFEYGIFGLYLYIYALLKIVFDLSKNTSIKTKHLIIGAFIMLGVPVLLNNNYMLHLFLGVLIICYYVDKKVYKI